ncbi:uncharacterized protein EV154DRAFT_581248 [Mucor mucedo]|uniref:uncharacterized protein n=1 Tax=Mucor mucedo TaxID=29922 RepID=UPI00221E8E97|nr:uncharacterized protein EV154DRAFT_581248 [Mucor mucedo]KAI7870287.1 hypothetical protein EV154DRAFT_581248 [Mucor mucedo]
MSHSPEETTVLPNEVQAVTTEANHQVQNIAEDSGKLGVADATNQEDTVMEDSQPEEEVLPILTPAQVVKKKVQEREAWSLEICKLYSKPEQRTEQDDMKIHQLGEAVKRITRTMNSYSEVWGTPGPAQRGTEASKYANMPSGSGGLAISRLDLPKCNIEGKVNEEFKNEPVFKNIDELLIIFEDIVSSADQDVEVIWKKYLSLTMNSKDKLWVRKEVMSCNNCTKAKEVIAAHFSNRKLRLRATQQLVSMKMRQGELLTQFDARFSRALEESGFEVSQQLIADLYLLALPVASQPVLFTFVSAHLREGQEHGTCDDVSQAASKLFSGKMPTEEEVLGEQEDTGKRRASKGTESRASKRRSLPPPSTAKKYCKNHGSNNSHTTEECAMNRRGAERRVEAESSRPARKLLDNRNQPRADTGNPRNHCIRDCFCGRGCEEFHNNAKTILSVSAAKQKREDEHYQFECKKTPNNTLNNFKNLITPIILYNRKLKGNVDTGSDLTCINKYIVDNFFPSLKINKINGTLNYLSNTAKRIGQTEPITIKYLNNVCFEFCFEVVEFNDTLETDFDVLLGTDILSKLNIRLTNVAYIYYDDDEINEELQFGSSNHVPSI